MSAASPLANAIGLTAATVIVGQTITSHVLRRARVPLSTCRGNSVQRTHPIVPNRRTLLVGAGLPASLVAMWFFGPVLCLAFATAIAGVLRGLPIMRQRRMQRQLARAVPDALDLVVVLLQAGTTPRQTVIELGRSGPRSTRPGFAAAALQLERGHSFGDAIGAVRHQLGDAMTPFVELISASERYGLPTAQVVQQLSNETRALRMRNDEAAARSLPVKLSFPLVMCTLPSFVLLAIAPAVLAALSSLGSHAW
jgi:pilus assembly protein TadC